jgi:hypothetical protein
MGISGYSRTNKQRHEESIAPRYRLVRAAKAGRGRGCESRSIARIRGGTLTNCALYSV